MSVDNRQKAPATSVLGRLQRRYPKTSKIVEAAQDLPFDISERQGRTGVGVQGNPVLCAIGKSLRSCPGVTGVLVYRARVIVVKGSTATRYAVPRSLKSEIDAFDKPGGAARFKPGRYTLKAPSKHERLDAPGRKTITKRLWEGKAPKARNPDGYRQW